MKNIRLKRVCLLFIIIVVGISCFLVLEKNWINTSFRSVSEVDITIDDIEYVFPLKEKTSIKYKTSDSSYVFISRGNMNEIKYFYESITKSVVEEKEGNLFISKDGKKYAIKRLADDLEYVMYSLSITN